MQWTWLEDRCRHVHIRSNACHHARLTLEHHEASSSSRRTHVTDEARTQEGAKVGGSGIDL